MSDPKQLSEARLQTRATKKEKFLKFIEPYRKGDVVDIKRKEIADALGISLSVVDRRFKEYGLKVTQKGRDAGVTPRVEERRERMKQYLEKHPKASREEISEKFEVKGSTLLNDLKAIGVDPPKIYHEATAEEKRDLRILNKMFSYYQKYNGESSISEALKKFDLSRRSWERFKKIYKDDERCKNFIKKNSQLSNGQNYKEKVLDNIRNTDLSFKAIAKVCGCSFSYVCRLNQIYHIRDGNRYASKKKKVEEN